MKLIIARPLVRVWRLLALCLLCMIVAMAISMGAEPMGIGQGRHFWVHDIGGTSFRKVHATLRAIGPHSYIYIADEFWGRAIRQADVAALDARLETSAPAIAISPTGLIPLLEKTFGPLPKLIQTDTRLALLVADLGDGSGPAGYYNPLDQLSEPVAQGKFHQHSNEQNIVYLNGLSAPLDASLGVVAHELTALLVQGNRAGAVNLDAWLSETLAQGATLLAGYDNGQLGLNDFAKETGLFPLATKADLQGAPQLLFSSFLLDSLEKSAKPPLNALAHSVGEGRSSVAALFQAQSGGPFPFDVIFSDFVSYVFAESQSQSALPLAWHHNEGIIVPPIAPYYSLPTPAADLQGWIAPYSFLAIDLEEELPPTAIVEVGRVDSPTTLSDPSTCAHSASVLWKPIHAKRIALYAVGCVPSVKGDKIQFHLKIRDNASLPTASSAKLLP